MKSRLQAVWLAAVNLLMWVVWPSLAAAQDTAEPDILDGRFENYGRPVTLHSSSTAMSWILLLVLALICVAVLFKNARRTHLD